MVCVNDVFLRLFLCVLFYLQNVECDKHTDQENVLQSVNSDQNDLGVYHELIVPRTKIQVDLKNGSTYENGLILNESSITPKYITFYRNRYATNVTRRLDYIDRRIKSDLYDNVTGTTYLCYTDEDCNNLLKPSTCVRMPHNTYDMKHCKCFQNYIFDGEKCQTKDSIHFCSSHEDCAALEGSRCTYLMVTKEKICKCSQNFIAEENKCLQEVNHGGNCISPKQCPEGIPCLMNVCRADCPYGYTKKGGYCFKDLPDIKPRYYDKEPSILTNSAVLVSIVGGVFFIVVLIVSLVAVILRRRIFQETRYSSSSNDPLASEFENSGISIQTPDEPPPYDEVMSSSTTALTTNAQEIDHPPSYKSWEEAWSRNSHLPQ